MRVAFVAIVLALTACELVLDLRDDYVVAETGQGGAAQNVVATSGVGGPASVGPGVGGGGAPNLCNVLVFDGMNDWVELPDDVLTETLSQTVEAWVEWELMSGEPLPLIGTMCGSFSASFTKLSVNLDNECDGTGGNREQEFNFTSPTRLAHFAMVTQDGMNATIYVDGNVAVPSGFVAPNTTGAQFKSSIGTKKDDATQPFMWAYTKMRLYGLRISSVAMYSRPFTPTFPLPYEAGVRANYKLQQAPSSMLEEETGDYAGFINGDPEWTTAPCPIITE